MFSPSMFRRVALVGFFTILLLLVVSCSSSTQSGSAPTAASVTKPTTTPISFDGQWEGSIKVAGQDIGIVVRCQSNGTELKAWLDIPGQSVKDYVLNKVNVEGSRLHFEAFGGTRNAVWDGELAADGSITGKFLQTGYEGTYTLRRTTMTPALPTADVP